MKNVGSFIAVLLMFGGGWYYLDSQRVEFFKIREEAIKLKSEADVKEKYLKQIESELSARQKQLSKAATDLSEREKLMNQDKELNQLTVKFVDELAHVNIFQECSDDEEHNGKVRKAEALLNLIEAKAKQYKRQDIIYTFVEKHRQGIYSLKAKCKQ